MHFSAHYIVISECIHALMCSAKKQECMHNNYYIIRL